MPTPWDKSLSKKNFPPLRKDAAVDVAIVGGGITGILSAYMLAKKGITVAVLEASSLGAGATMLTTAFITQVLDTSFSQWEKLVKPAEVRMIAESGAAAIDALEEIIKKEKINCDFMRAPVFEYANDIEQVKALNEEMKVMKKLGIEAELHAAGDLPFKNVGSLEVPNQAKFDPGKFLSAIIASAAAQGAMFFENTEVKEISGDGPIVLTTDGGIVTAQDVIIATYHPITDEGTQFKKGMYHTYVEELAMPAGQLQEALYWDLNSPYHYFRVDRVDGGGKDRIIFGGEDHKWRLEGADAKSREALRGYIEGTFSGLDYEFTNQWDGPIVESSDGLALVGAIKSHYYVATAFSGNGMTYAMIAAIMFEDLIAGRKNRWTKIYDPTRSLASKKTATKARDYSEELMGGLLKNLLK